MRSLVSFGIHSQAGAIPSHSDGNEATLASTLRGWPLQTEGGADCAYAITAQDKLTSNAVVRDIRIASFSGGGGGEFDDEAGAGGGVLFGADGAVVFLDDLGGDGEAESGATLFGGEVGEEEALAHV